MTKLLDADASKEVAVLGAVWINAPIKRYVDAVTDIETFRAGRRVQGDETDKLTTASR